MAPKDAYPEHIGLSDLEYTATAARHPRVLERMRWRRADRKHARLMSTRNRRAMARRLRDIAKAASDRDPIRRRNDVLLHYRAAAVRTELLEIAALIERVHDPDPELVQALNELLAYGDSPLYHPGVPAAQLHATLDYVRAGLARD
jgi:hypothetical protein